MWSRYGNEGAGLDSRQTVREFLSHLPKKFSLDGLTTSKCDKLLFDSAIHSLEPSFGHNGQL